MRILSWNVNGLRACYGKGFLDVLASSEADIVALQEVRARAEQLDEAVRAPAGWFTAFNSAKRSGYSGVGIYARREPDSLETSLGEERFDSEGRLQLARFGRLVLANVYFPNGSGKDRDNSRVPFKLDFYRALHTRLGRLRRGGLRVLVVGDFNIAHREIDLARPKQNRKASGFLPEECEELDRWLQTGWVDTFRRQEKGGGHYTWWSQRFGVRKKNIGWRLDYVLASPSALPFVQRAFIQPEILGSDHCPIGVDVDAAITRRA
ncbi:MAG: exodeoxyribonuclease III [Deltaproteobacteria bacterium]|nr:exodeoxyribonuclease III [Deltaproteobacteria bacterium]